MSSKDFSKKGKTKHIKTAILFDNGLVFIFLYFGFLFSSDLLTEAFFISCYLCQFIADVVKYKIFHINSRCFILLSDVFLRLNSIYSITNRFRYKGMFRRIHLLYHFHMKVLKILLLCPLECPPFTIVKQLSKIHQAFSSLVKYLSLLLVVY